MSWDLDAVTVCFGPTTALDDVTLHVDDGEIVVVLGPSGCGKSTLLRVLAGLQPVDQGRVLIDGDDATHRPPHSRGIGMVFQEPTLFSHRDVAGNVEFGLRMTRVAAEERRTRTHAMLELVGLADFGTRDVTTLSGGEAQRVALARALAPRPRILLLDEPLGALDRVLRDRLVDELPTLLRATGTAAVHVTHDHDEAFAMADRVAVMAAGAVVRTASPRELVADPRAESVARFLGQTNIVGAGAERRLIRRDAATVDPSGELEARVVAVQFRRDQSEVTFATKLGDLSFVLDDPLGVGDVVRLALDPTRAVPLDPT